MSPCLSIRHRDVFRRGHSPRRDQPATPHPQVVGKRSLSLSLESLKEDTLSVFFKCILVSKRLRETHAARRRDSRNLIAINLYC